MAFSRVSRDSASVQRSGRPKSRSATRVAISASHAPGSLPGVRPPLKATGSAVWRASHKP